MRGRWSHDQYIWLRFLWIFQWAGQVCSKAWNFRISGQWSIYIVLGIYKSVRLLGSVPLSFSFFPGEEITKRLLSLPWFDPWFSPTLLTSMPQPWLQVLVCLDLCFSIFWCLASTSSIDLVEAWCRYQDIYVYAFLCLNWCSHQLSISDEVINLSRLMLVFQLTFIFYCNEA